MCPRRTPVTRDEVVAATEPLHGLPDAYRLITADLSVPNILEGTVRACAELTGARYVAIAVVGEDGSLEHCAHRDADEPARTAPIRPRADTANAAALRIPVQPDGSEVLGELYLSDPGAGRFGAEDEATASALAATAAAAVVNARRLDEARRSRDWLDASSEIARALLAGADDEVILTVVSRALSVAEADYTCLVLPTDDKRMRVAVATGLGSDEFSGLVFDPTRSTLGRAMLQARGISTHDVTLWVEPGFPNRYGFGPAMVVPLVDLDHAGGAILMVRLAGRPLFTAQEIELASTFAAQVALAVELNAARSRTEQMRVLQIRHRIAHELHDSVIQRLFAIGVGLQALTESGVNTAVAQRLTRHIVDLDETIDEIRTRVFDLDPDKTSSGSADDAGPHGGRAQVPSVALGQDVVI